MQAVALHQAIERHWDTCPCLRACDGAIADNLPERVRNELGKSDVPISAIELACLMAELGNDENMGIKAIRMVNGQRVG